MPEINIPEIHKLEESTINRIAAGEVVERPLSVVKELVENALDAGATLVEIKMEGAGDAFISVRDNGRGIRPGEMALALAPHATSKLRRIEDLENISTMGFRGEALASIAAVSRLSILSRTAAETAARLIRAEGGPPGRAAAAAGPVGTTVTVEDLFFNTPARRKFLRSAQTEAGLIAEMTGRLAVGRPDVAFRLSRGGKTIVATPGNGRLLDAIGAVWGRETARRLLPVAARRGEWEISGFISEPGFARSNRQHQVFLLRSRVVRSAGLAKALGEAYHTLTPAGLCPVAVLNLSLPPGETDVNVHPAKLEVKFRAEREVEEFLRASARAVLTAHDRARPLGWDDREIRPSRRAGTEPALRPRSPGAEPAALPEQIRFLYAPVPPARFGAAPAAGAAEPPAPYPAAAPPEYPPACPPAPDLAAPEPAAPDPAAPEPAAGAAAAAAVPRFAGLRPLAQLFQTYILAADETNLYIIDQHAAHERVRYERLLAETRRRPAAAQMLLTPETLTLSWQEEQVFLEYYEQLRDLGFILEEFGPQTYLLRAAPCTGPYASPTEVFHRFLAETLSGGAPPAAERLLERWVFLTACRGSVKAAEPLALPAMEELLHLLGQTENPYTCPHGRPVLLAMSRAELEKKFYRT
ncbi:MAG: DNA mismatch repair endonuclease MutL [Gracilibacteraceae bacterium]|jgi:DNA mismatch repair protein MutL|nr:DNA mismatch repair endonuclease MutL [Gracilibacteraceae bacterium]